MAIAAMLFVATLTPANAQVDIGNHDDLFTKLINAFMPVLEAINGNILYVASEIQVLHHVLQYQEQQIDELKADVANLQASLDMITAHMNITHTNGTNGINGTNANMTNATTTMGGN